MDIRQEFDDWQTTPLGKDNQALEGGVSNSSSFTFISIVLVLTVLGLVMLYSASYNEALIHDLPHYYFLVRQAMFVGLALVCSIIIRYVPLSWIRKAAYPLLLLALGLLLLTLFTGFGQERLGSRRWLQIGSLPSLQPSEFAKVAVILFLASYYHFDRTGQKVLVRYGVPILVILLFSALILLQRDYSSTMLFLAICCALLVVSGLKLSHLLLLLAFLSVPAVVVMLSQPYRVKRVFSFLFPSLDPAGMSYQVTTSLKAIEAGGLFGKGLGNGEYKLGILPEVQSDFIFSSICEEVGFIGAAFILALFAMMAILGYNAAKRLYSRDRFLSLSAFGITSMILFQAVMNIAVVIGLLPPTGIPLPFFSQGGTNLFVLLCCCAFLYRILLISNGKLSLDGKSATKDEKDDGQGPEV